MTFGLFKSVEGHEQAEKELSTQLETLFEVASESPCEDERRAFAVRDLMYGVMGAERYKGYGATDTVCEEALVSAINSRLNANIGRFSKYN